MSTRRGGTGHSGVLLVDKPAGMTSHDVVNRVRRAFGERRVGHAGTLDPLATGLLVVLVGPATRLAPFLTAADKTYQARIVFGFETDTDDAEGRVTASAEVPDEVGDPFFAAGTVASLVGVHEQVPPAYSAIKRGGVVAHRAARAGEALEIEPRSIEVFSAKLLGVECTREYAWDVELTVSKGTYVRAIARDLGRAVGSAAHLDALRRTHAGSLDIADAHTLEQIESAENPAALFSDPLRSLGLPIVHVSDEAALRVRDGAALDAEANGGESLGADAAVGIAHQGSLLAVYRRSGTRLKPEAVFFGGVGGVA